MQNICDAKKFQEVLCLLPMSVHILATKSKNSWRAITVSSVISFSMDPPSMLICLQKAKEYNKLFLENKRFTINSLSASQRDLAYLFGGKIDASAEVKLTYLENTSQDSFVVKNALLVFDCVLEAFYEHFTHYILIAKVIEVYQNEDSHKTPILVRTKNNMVGFKNFQ